jgi:hypothetical protein
MSGPDTCKVPLLNLNMPSLGAGQLLDSSGLLLPQDGFPATPDMLAAAMSSAGLGGLISPHNFFHSWTPKPTAMDQNMFQKRRSSEVGVGV